MYFVFLDFRDTELIRPDIGSCLTIIFPDPPKDPIDSTIPEEDTSSELETDQEAVLYSQELGDKEEVDIYDDEDYNNKGNE